MPTLADLLTPPTDRPKMFLVGSNELDTARVGFASSLSGQGGFAFDTTVPGNWNTGHVYGTDLPADDKLALLEYLKTL